MKIVLMLLLMILPLSSQAEARVFTFGIVPQQSAQVLAKSWNPIMSYLEKETGYPFKFVTAPSIPEFEKRCAAGEYDVAYMNPYHYTTFSQHPGYQAFAKQANKKIQGIIVVRKDSAIKRLEQLASEPLAFPAPAAFAASVLTRAYLENKKIAFKPNYVYSHDAVYKSVSSNTFVAGGGILRTFNKVDPAIRDQLKVLMTTEKFTPHAFATHPDLSPSFVQNIRQAMSKMHQSDEGRALLKPIGFSAIEMADDNQWDDVRGLNIRLLDRLVKG